MTERRVGRLSAGSQDALRRMFSGGSQGALRKLSRFLSDNTLFGTPLNIPFLGGVPERRGGTQSEFSRTSTRSLSGGAQEALSWLCGGAQEALSSQTRTRTSSRPSQVQTGTRPDQANTHHPKTLMWGVNLLILLQFLTIGVQFDL